MIIASYINTLVTTHSKDVLFWIEIQFLVINFIHIFFSTPSTVLNNSGVYGYPHCDSLRADKDLLMNLTSQVRICGFLLENT